MSIKTLSYVELSESIIKGSGIYAWVDISHCGFISKPVLQTSIDGIGGHGYMVGSSNPYHVSETEFKLYLFDRDRDVHVTTKRAVDGKWFINYHATGKIC